MRVEFVANKHGKPPDYQEVERTHKVKVADASLVFDEGPLAGLALTGFVVWQSPTNAAVLFVSPPERTVNTGAARGATYALLRPFEADIHNYRPGLTPALRAFILDAFGTWRDVEAAAEGA